MGIQKLLWHERACPCKYSRSCTVMHGHTKLCMVITVTHSAVTSNVQNRHSHQRFIKTTQRGLYLRSKCIINVFYKVIAFY